MIPKDKPQDRAIFQTEEDFRLSPEQAVLRIRALDYIDKLVNDSKFIDLLSAEDILTIVKEVVLYSATFFKEDFWDIRYRNPEVIAGETNTDQHDKLTLGTVSSKREYIYKKTVLPANKQLVEFFYNLYSVIADLLKQLEQGAKVDNIAPSESLLKSLNHLARKIRQPGATRLVETPVEERKARPTLDVQVRKNRQLGYWLRKEAKARKSRQGRNTSRSNQQGSKPKSHKK